LTENKSRKPQIYLTWQHQQTLYGNGQLHKKYRGIIYPYRCELRTSPILHLIRKKNTKANVYKNGISTIKTLLTKVTHQCINFVAAGTDIITVRVLNSMRVVCASPTIYIWCPHTKNPRKAMVYIEYKRLALAETLLRR